MVELRSASQVILTGRRHCLNDRIQAIEFNIEEAPAPPVSLNHFHFGNSCRVMAMMQGLAQDLPVTLALLKLPVYPK